MATSRRVTPSCRALRFAAVLEQPTTPPHLVDGLVELKGCGELRGRCNYVFGFTTIRPTRSMARIASLNVCSSLPPDLRMWLAKAPPGSQRFCGALCRACAAAFEGPAAPTGFAISLPSNEKLPGLTMLPLRLGLVPRRWCAAGYNCVLFWRNSRQEIVRDRIGVSGNLRCGRAGAHKRNCPGAIRRGSYFLTQVDVRCVRACEPGSCRTRIQPPAATHKRSTDMARGCPAFS
jgi:hypothetical protein